MASPTLRSRLALATLVVAAGASIATSTIHSWEAGDFVDGAPFTLSDGQAEARIGLEVEANADCFGAATQFTTLDVSMHLTALHAGAGTDHPEVEVSVWRVDGAEAMPLGTETFVLALDEEPFTRTFDASGAFDDCIDGQPCSRAIAVDITRLSGGVVYVDWAANVWMGGPIEAAPEDPVAELFVTEEPQLEGGGS